MVLVQAFLLVTRHRQPLPPPPPTPSSLPAFVFRDPPSPPPYPRKVQGLPNMPINSAFRVRVVRWYPGESVDRGAQFFELTMLWVCCCIAFQYQFCICYCGPHYRSVILPIGLKSLICMHTGSVSDTCFEQLDPKSSRHRVVILIRLSGKQQSNRW